jgi:hypothetical protein
MLMYSGADPGFQVRGRTLKNCAERREARKYLGISCEKSRFYAKKSFFFPNFRGARAGCAPWIRPCVYPDWNKLTIKWLLLGENNRKHRHINCCMKCIKPVIIVKHSMFFHLVFYNACEYTFYPKLFPTC